MDGYGHPPYRESPCLRVFVGRITLYRSTGWPFTERSHGGCKKRHPPYETTALFQCHQYAPRRGRHSHKLRPCRVDLASPIHRGDKLPNGALVDVKSDVHPTRLTRPTAALASGRSGLVRELCCLLPATVKSSRASPLPQKRLPCANRLLDSQRCGPTRPQPATPDGRSPNPLP